MIREMQEQVLTLAESSLRLVERYISTEQHPVRCMPFAVLYKGHQPSTLRAIWLSGQLEHTNGKVEISGTKDSFTHISNLVEGLQQQIH